MSRVILFPATPPVSDEGFLLRELVPLHTAVALPRRRHRRLVTSAGRWALANGLSLPADHVALWAAVAQHGGGHGDVDGITGPWFAVELGGFLSSTLRTWCAVAGCLPPSDLSVSLGHLYTFLADSGRLHPGGDRLEDLRAALASSRSHPDAVLLPLAPGPTAA